MSAPRLHARFLLSDVGDPQYVERDGRTHYWVRLSVIDAPAEASAATYELHDSFRKPVHEAGDREKGFPVDLTSYGDFAIRTVLRGSGTELRASLASLLAAEHGFSVRTSVRWAIASIGAL
jgi:hypothetical protein